MLAVAFKVRSEVLVMKMKDERRVIVEEVVNLLENFKKLGGAVEEECVR